ncbi:hypothetical protein MRB53_021739 [Persea americana]|uniref:Uncharacterized protein n=1 Tax=Persea americana TaxID=3435 RepID=A0ACC2L505_PERAE|nr:hypothetical protein MRB53_021739 [Persea americana]
MSGDKPKTKKETEKDSAGGAMSRMMDRISKCMTEDSINRISVLGWEGMGRSIIIKKLVDQHSYRFDDVKRVSASDCDDAEDLQTEIKAALGIKKDVKDAPKRIASALNLKKVLLILEDVNKPIKLDQIISPDWEEKTQSSSKVVVTTASEEVFSEMGIKESIREEVGCLSEDDAWDLLCQEATALSQSSELKNHFLSNSGESVMQCFVYCLAFSDGMSIDTFTLYPMSEGFICGFRNWKEMHEFGINLMEALNDRVPSSIKPKIVAVLNREGVSYSNTAQIILRGFVLRQHEAEAPKVLKGDVERALLVGCNLQKLEDAGLPPDCTKLATLILSDSPQLGELPDQAFNRMQGLGVLDLSGTGISSLPSSLSCLSKLKLLALRNCHNLNDLPVSLIVSHLGKLQVLHLQGTPLQKLTEASFDHMGELVFLNISAASYLTKLSLKGCRSLQRLCAPVSLEALDLSSTGIEDLAEFGISELNHLKRLILLDTKNLTRAPWYEISHLPETLVWDQCSTDYSKAAEDNQGYYYCISVADPEIFENLGPCFPLWDKYFKKFRFSIVSPDRRNDEDGDEDPFLSKHFIYNGIYAAQTQQQHHSSQLARSYDRCLVINGGHHSLLNIGGVLYNTESLYLSNDVIEKIYEEIDPIMMMMLSNLKDCRIEKCRRMKALGAGFYPMFENLKNLWIFDLENLSFLSYEIDPPGFSCLRNMYIEHCPNLGYLFHYVSSLESLETLEIRFCGKLTEVIRMDEGKPFPRLKELCLWELPSLNTICEEHMPALNKLKVRGCQQLKTLPIHDNGGPEMETQVVHIRGEQEWWNNMDWLEQGDIPKCVRFEGLPEFQWN